MLLHTPATHAASPIILAPPGTLLDHDEEFGPMEEAVRKRFPHAPIGWAYTSPFIRKRLVGYKKVPPTLEEALDHWIDRGFPRVSVQPLQIIPGEEFHRLAKIVCRGRLDVSLGRPLLDNARDYDAVLSFSQSMLPLGSDTGLVLVVHGTRHPAQACYEALEHRITVRGHRRTFLGSLSGEPSLQALSRNLADRGIRSVRLLPFLVATGGHVLEDIGGRRSNSWRRQLEKQGFAVEVIEHGLIRFPPITRIFVRHLEDL